MRKARMREISSFLCGISLLVTTAHALEFVDGFAESDRSDRQREHSDRRSAHQWRRIEPAKTDQSFAIKRTTALHGFDEEHPRYETTHINVIHRTFSSTNTVSDMTLSKHRLGFSLYSGEYELAKTERTPSHKRQWSNLALFGAHRVEDSLRFMWWAELGRWSRDGVSLTYGETGDTYVANLAGSRTQVGGTMRHDPTKRISLLSSAWVTDHSVDRHEEHGYVTFPDSYAAEFDLGCRVLDWPRVRMGINPQMVKETSSPLQTQVGMWANVNLDVLYMLVEVQKDVTGAFQGTPAIWGVLLEHRYRVGWSTGVGVEETHFRREGRFPRSVLVSLQTTFSW